MFYSELLEGLEQRGKADPSERMELCGRIGRSGGRGFTCDSEMQQPSLLTLTLPSLCLPIHKMMIQSPS